MPLCLEGLAALLAGASVGARSSSPVVPISAQQAISRKVDIDYRYVPTVKPSSWRYDSWEGGRGGLGILFRVGAQRLPFPVFGAVFDRSCTLRPRMKLFRIHGVAVAWSTTFADSEAWRCLRVAGQVPRRISVSDRGTGFDKPNTIDRRARLSATMVATARHLR
jgi:hypothetical protein